MYISNFSIVGQGPNYGKYKMINKYDENVSASNLLTRNNPINLLDMYQPNSISDISSLVDSDTTKLLFYNLHKYTYDQTTNPNGPIKKDALTDTLVSTENWHLGDRHVEKLFYISADKTLSTNTISGAGNMIILHPLDYYFYYNTGYQYRLNIGNKPSNFTFNETTNNYINIIGNVTTDMINKFESGVFDKPYILLKDCTIPSNVKEALDKIFIMCDDPTKYQFKINDVGLNNNLPTVYSYNYLYYVTIIETTSFNFKVLEMNGTLIQQVNITIQ